MPMATSTTSSTTAWFDTAVNQLPDRGRARWTSMVAPTIGLVVETHCNYFDSLAFPQQYRGRTARRAARPFQLGALRELACSPPARPRPALHAGHFVHVYVDRDRHAGRSTCPNCLARRYQKALEGLHRCEPLRPADHRNKALPSTTAITSAPFDACLSAPSRCRARPSSTSCSVASRAPSGTNTQPWQVACAHRRCAKHQLCASASWRCFNEPAVAAPRISEEYAYYPSAVGVALYRPAPQGGLGSVRPAGHRQGRQGPHARSSMAATTLFFDAPVGLIFTIDRVMKQGSWLDYGMFLQNIMIAARGHAACDTCPQAAFTQYHRLIAEAVAGSAPERDAGLRHGAGRMPIRQAIENTSGQRARAGRGLHAIS